MAGIYDFENRRLGTDLPPFFPDIDSRFKFCALIVGGPKRTFPETHCGFFLPDANTINDPDRAFTLSPDDFARVNPNTGTAPVFRTRRDADLTRRIYQSRPVLADRSGGQEVKVWPMRYRQGLFHSQSHSHLFRTALQLENDGYYPVHGNRWKRGDQTYLPLYQGRMVGQFDHRLNSVRYNPDNIHNAYLSEEVSEAQHSDPKFLPMTRHWVPIEDVEAMISSTRGWTLTFRDIARPTDVRTMIAALIPKVGCVDTLAVLTPDEPHPDPDCKQTESSRRVHFDSMGASCLLANFNSFVFDFVTRQKVQATHIKMYTLEQLPVIEPPTYNRRFGDRTAADLVRHHVLRLTYTSLDMAPFARDLGHHGPPFPWDEEERRHLRARLDALYFHLYNLDRDDASYILSTFPIIQRQDQAQFDGRYRTRDLILAYMNALTAGDTSTIVTL